MKGFIAGIPFIVGVCISLAALVVLSYSLTLKYWLTYALVIPYSGTISGFAATGSITTTAHMGLWKSCYTVVTVITVTLTSTTTTTTTSDCIDSDSTSFISGDDIRLLQKLAIMAAVFVGLAMLAGIVAAVITLLPKPLVIAKRVVAFTAVGAAVVALIMVIVAIMLLKDKLVTGMSIGSTNDYAVACSILLGFTTVAYIAGAVLLMVHQKGQNKVMTDDMNLKKKETPDTEADTAVANTKS